MMVIDELPVVCSWDEAIDATSPVRTSFQEGEIIFDYLVRPAKSDTLVVFFPAAMERGKRRVPSFYRWTYCENLNSNVISVSDPTLHLDDEMLGGWFVGNESCWALDAVVDHIARYALHNCIDKIVLSGSSLGGFASLVAAHLFHIKHKHNLKVRVIAENPQVSLLDYIWINHIKLLGKVCFKVDDLSKIPFLELRRFVLQEHIDGERLSIRGVAIFKEADEHHFDVHRQYLLSLNTNLHVVTIPTIFDATGHTPLTQSMFHFALQMLNWDIPNPQFSK